MRKLPISPFVLKNVVSYNSSVELCFEIPTGQIQYVAAFTASYSPDAVADRFVPVRVIFLIQIISNSYPFSRQQKRYSRISDPAQCNCRENIHGLPEAGIRLSDIVRKTDT